MGEIYRKIKAILQMVCKLSLPRFFFWVLIAMLAHCYFDISKQPFTMCENNKHCFFPAWRNNSRFQLIVAVSTPERSKYYGLELIYTSNKFDVFSPIDLNLNLVVPTEVRQNGTMHLHLLLTILEDSLSMSFEKAIMDRKTTTAVSIMITKHMMPGQQLKYLLQRKNHTNKEVRRKIWPIAHWIPQLHFHTVPEPYAVKMFAEDYGPYVKFNQEGKYFPFFYANELETSIKEFLPLNRSTVIMPLKLSYSPASLGDLRIYSLFSGLFTFSETSGRTAEQLEHLRSILFNTSFFWLKITLIVACVHILLEAIAFKKDINFWKNRKNMHGLSLRTTIWRFISHFIIIFHLWDQGTNKFLLIPIGFTAFIEMWKILKLRKINLYFSGWKLKLRMGTFSEEEQKSLDFDYVVTHNLILLLLPVFLGFCIYCLCYKQYTGWQSYIIETSVHGVYAFGFLFMIPQLLLNYKLKSVAHLPLTALAFKVCSTFIDDFFAIIVKLPTVHRIACFRDDIVLFIYIIQWWIYPSDRKRVNEYGESGSENLNLEQEPKASGSQTSSDEYDRCYKDSAFQSNPDDDNTTAKTYDDLSSDESAGILKPKKKHRKLAATNLKHKGKRRRTKKSSSSAISS